MNTLSGNINTVFSQFTTISDNITSLKSQIDTINSTPQNIAGTQISEEDESVLDAIIGSIHSLIIQVSTTFAEMATFMKSVIFQSTVTFQGRVTFEDRDMGGTATLQT
jgi:hypothetical protein